jgi:hypothetical protein
MAELDVLDVVRDGIEPLCLCHHLVGRCEDEFGILVDELFDQPRARLADRASIRSKHLPRGLLHPADLPYLQTNRSNPGSVMSIIELGARIKSS